MDRSLIMKLLAIAVLLMASIGLYSYAQNVHAQNSPFTPQEAPTRGYDKPEEAIAAITVINRELLDKALPQISVDVMNQIHREHYSLTGNIDRLAEISSNIARTDKTYTFTIRFLDSGDKLRVKIIVQNIATRDYSLSVEKES